MQAKDNEINPKGNELESEKTTPKESTDLADEEIIKINFEEFLKTPEADKKIDLSVKGILDDPKEIVEPILTPKEKELMPDALSKTDEVPEKEETNVRKCSDILPVTLSQDFLDFVKGKAPGDGVY
jgi:hypothetical protein